MFNTRSVASILACGNNAYYETLAATNNIADEFLQLATQAPQPNTVGASNASSASFLLIGIVFASIVFPEVFTDINPPACWILSKELRSTTTSFTTRNAAARKGSIVIVSPSLNIRMCN